MKKLRHKFILSYLKPKWFLTRLWRMTAYDKPLKAIIKMEKTVRDIQLKALRDQDTQEIFRSEGREEVVKWLHDLFK